MCGVAGILRFDGAPVDPSALSRMSHALAHRGPDGTGIEVLGPCGLMHRRLAIIDLSPAGRQPMSTADGGLWLTYNGEVYNYLELRRELVTLGHDFRTESDSEVILAAYRQWGEDCFSRFNGMWGLALWDTRARRLILARDRLGVKPLYFHRSPSRLLFASEQKGLLAAEPSLAALDLDTMARWLERGVVGYGRPTFLLGVERLPAATALIVEADGSQREERYWRFRPPERPLALGPAAAAEQVRELLIDSVRLRFRSDVPVGTCLSGGLDSSSIVAIAGRRLGKAPETFSAIYPHPDFDEAAFVRIMVRELGLTGHEVSPDGADLPAVMERATYHMDEPTAGPGIYSQWHVMALAAPRVKVLLDGQGGDELFGGYHSSFETYFRTLLDRALAGELEVVPELVRAQKEILELSGQDQLKLLLSRLRRRAGRELGAASRRLVERLGPALEQAGGARELLEVVQARLAPAPRASHLSPELRARLTAARWTFSTPRVTGDRLTDGLWDQLTRTHIPGLLHYEDRDSMAFSIEARVPFLDYRLVELAFSLSTAERIQGARTKYVLREAMRDILPEAIRERRDKKGYPTPFSLWLRGPLADWVREVLFSQRARGRGLVDPAVVQSMLEEHLAGRRDAGWSIWQLVTTELFLRRFFDGPFVVGPASERSGP